MAEKFDLSVILRFIDKSAQGLKGFQANMSAVGKKMQSVGKTMSLAITAPIIGLGVNAIRMGVNFQAAMNMVGAVTGSTGKEFEQLKKIARDLGATTQFSATQAAEAMKFMGMAGFDANKIMAAVPKVLELAAAAQLDMGSAANITTNIMSGFGFAAKDMARVNDILVNTFTNANVNLVQMGEALKKVGPIASKLKFRFTEISAALGLMGNAGIQGSEAGVALRRALINLQNPTKQQKEAMRFMELEFKNANGTMKDLAGIIGEYENAAKKGADETQIMTSMMQIFGARAVAPMLALLAAGSKGLAEMEEKTKKVGTASRIAKRQMEGLPGALKLIQSAWEAVNIALTEGAFGKWVEETIRGFAAVLTEVVKFIDTNPEIVKWGLAVAAVFAVSGPLLIGLGFVAVAIGAISLPLVAVVAGLTALGGLAALLISNWKPIKEFFSTMWNEITSDMNKTWDLAQQRWSEFMDKIKPIVKFFSDMWNEITVEMGKTLSLAEQRWNEFVEKIRFIWEPVIKFFTDSFKVIEDLIPDFLKGKPIKESKAPADVSKLGGLGGAAAGFIPKSLTEITVKVESENGTTAKIQNITQTGPSKVRVENKSAVGPTLLAVGGL